MHSFRFMFFGAGAEKSKIRRDTYMSAHKDLVTSTLTVMRFATTCYNRCPASHAKLSFYGLYRRRRTPCILPAQKRMNRLLGHIVSRILCIPSPGVEHHYDIDERGIVDPLSCYYAYWALKGAHAKPTRSTRKVQASKNPT